MMRYGSECRIRSRADDGISAFLDFAAHRADLKQIVHLIDDCLQAVRRPTHSRPRCATVNHYLLNRSNDEMHGFDRRP
jgi:hypothetical protein